MDTKIDMEKFKIPFESLTVALNKAFYHIPSHVNVELYLKAKENEEFLTDLFSDGLPLMTKLILDSITQLILVSITQQTSMLYTYTTILPSFTFSYAHTIFCPS